MWTDQDLDTLRQGAAAGLSGTQIAMRLQGRTRNAVIGKLSRMGLRTSGQSYWPVFWTAERNKQLLEMLSQEYTQVEMARKIGTTRKAITSHLSRLRVKGDAPPADLSTRYRPQKVTKRYSALTGLLLLTASPKPLPAPRYVAADAHPRRLKFLDLQSQHCRFILDDHGQKVSTEGTVYCGADTVRGGSWCLEHRRVVFAP